MEEFVDFTFHQPQNNTECDDCILAYTKEVTTLGLFYEEYCREGDDKRVLCYFKFLLPLYKGKIYSFEVLYTLYQYYYVLSPREAEGCRFINVSGIL